VIRTFFSAVTVAVLLVSAIDAQACSGCGCRGGPGYRGSDVNCVSWKALARVCGTPATTEAGSERNA